jgi:hypothetical protein
MGSVADRIDEDMMGVVGNEDAQAELMYQMIALDEKVISPFNAKQYHEAVESAGKFIQQVREYQAENPGVSQFFEFRLAELYRARAMAYTKLGNQNNDTSMKKLALADTERVLKIPRLPDETRDACERLKRALATEIAEEEKKCFIATAAYGTASAPEIMVLSRYRDMHLRTKRWGRFFIEKYERYSPFWARAIAPHPAARNIVRKMLVSPAVWFVQRIGSIDPCNWPQE